METQNKGTQKSWKDKAISRSKIIKSQNKELVRQRAMAKKWKQSSQSNSVIVKSQGLIIDSQALIINKLAQDKSRVRNVGSKVYKRIQGYKFPLSLIWLSIQLNVLGLSVRKVCASLLLIRHFLGAKFEVPSYGIINVWTQKMGYYMLENGCKKASEQEKWCIIIDESYSLGKSQLFLVLGVPLSRIESGKAISYKDVCPIIIRSQAQWRSDDVAIIIEETKKKVVGEIVYVVSDRGSNLIKAYKDQGLPHVPDWSHFGANILEACYAKEPIFVDFKYKMGLFKMKRKQSIFSYYVPSSLSTKVRFMNFKPFLEWANIMLKNFKKIPLEIRPELDFLNDTKPYIMEMTDLFYMVDSMGTVIKANGMNFVTKSKMIEMMESLQLKYKKSPRVELFIRSVHEYFDITIPIYVQHVNNNKPKQKNAPFLDGVIASSDVIESIFGKIKHRGPSDAKRGFTAIVLMIPLFCSTFSMTDTLNAMQSITTSKLEEWKNKNLCNRKHISFRNVFNNKSKNGATSAKAA
jgi:hypothetical protein